MISHLRADGPVLITTGDGLGHLTLNRPRAINALDHEMVGLITAALTAWEHDDDVAAVIISGAGDRGLCAGGDIRAIYQDALSGGTASIDFWRDEYLMNYLIARYVKPVVALMDGLVMGGGVGLAAHASHRIVTDRTQLAMPEVTIGLIPDVGGTYLLARAPGWLGLHAGLTGTRLGAADVITLGMADHYVDHRDLAELVATIAVNGVESAVYSFGGSLPPGSLPAQRTWVDNCYGAPTPQEIVLRLRSAGQPEAQAAADAITAASPTCVTASLLAIRTVRSEAATLEQALNLEFRAVNAALRSTDLAEGIRAQVIDKDRQPVWSPPTFDGVTDERLRSFFAPVDNPPFPEQEELVVPQLFEDAR
ncbi:enoyl-CoA hydratase [Nakamurella sp. UYEF19]|uniref:enoyl-CoA hydratase/isomerase family protein n=1 Tax=Nakamurella sp. UYEF19 TaxID=1756392 RepID=UPI00339979E2